MKNIVCGSLLVVMLCLAVSAAFAADYSYSGGLSSNSGGIHLEGSWGPVNLNWNVTQNSQGTWDYLYNLNCGGRAISHFVLETSTSFTSQNIWLANGPVTIGLWTSQQGNPQLPEPVHGIKFSATGQTALTYSFTSDRAPVWGDFYTRDGSGYYAWNGGFAHPDTDPLALPANGSVGNHVLVPDTVSHHDTNSVPEPGSIALGLCALGGMLGGVVRRRRMRSKPA